MHVYKVGDIIEYDDNLRYKGQGIVDHISGTVTCVGNGYVHIRMDYCFPDADCRRNIGSDFCVQCVDRYLILIGGVDDSFVGVDFNEERPVDALHCMGLDREEIDRAAYDDFMRCL